MRCNSLPTLFTLAVALALGGCTVGPDYVQPEIETVPDAWNTAATKGLAEGESSIETWWSVFDDATLTSLIDRARTSNLTLREAVWRVEEARALRGIAVGQRVPQVGVSGDATRTEASKNGPLGEVVPGEFFEAQDLYDLGVGASWELDLWGRIRRQVEAADAEMQASVEDDRDVLVALFAEVATSYVDVRAFQERLRFAHANVEGQEDTLRLTRDRFDAGLVSALDVAQAESNLANTKALIPSLELQQELALNRLAVLLGTNPGAVHDLSLIHI